MSETETKTCPMCAETIKAAARLCPYCHSKQGRRAFLRQEVAAGLGGVVLLIVACAVVGMISPEEKGIGGRSFGGHRDDLLVLSTSLDRASARPDFWLAGIVTNKSEHPWRIHELEVRFLDERGGLLDVRHPKVKELPVVQPRHEHGFRAELGEVVFTNSRVIHQVRVQLATDGDRSFEPD